MILESHPGQLAIYETFKHTRYGLILIRPCPPRTHPVCLSCAHYLYFLTVFVIINDHHIWKPSRTPTHSTDALHLYYSAFWFPPFFPRFYSRVRYRQLLWQSHICTQSWCALCVILCFSEGTVLKYSTRFLQKNIKSYRYSYTVVPPAPPFSTTQMHTCMSWHSPLWFKHHVMHR